MKSPSCSFILYLSAESSDSKATKRDYGRSILERKKVANRLVVNEAIDDDNSVVALHTETMEKLQLFRGDTILIKEEKGCWLWKIPPPEVRKRAHTNDVGDVTKIKIVRRKTHMMSGMSNKTICSHTSKEILSQHLSCTRGHCQAG